MGEGDCEADEWTAAVKKFCSNEDRKGRQS